MAQTDYLVEAELDRIATESSPDAIIIVDDSGTILRVNAQAELLTGRSRKALTGLKVEVLVPEGLREKHREHRGTYMSDPYRKLMGPDLDLVILRHTEDGDREVPIDLNLSPVPASIGTVVVATIRQRGAAQWHNL